MRNREGLSSVELSEQTGVTKSSSLPCNEVTANPDVSGPIALSAAHG
jgi:hypothetical protein